MSFREDILEKFDVDKNGKVNLGDAVTAAENQFGAIAVRWGFGGFVAGVVLTFVLLKVVL